MLSGMFAARHARLGGGAGEHIDIDDDDNEGENDDENDSGDDAPVRAVGLRAHQLQMPPLSANPTVAELLQVSVVSVD